MFSRFTIPIYYADGHVGHIDECGARMLANGYLNFAQLSAEDQSRFQGEDDMTKSRAGRKPKIAAEAETLITALNFVGCATKQEHLVPNAYNHVRIGQGYMLAYDGMIAAGYPVQHELNICPRVDLMHKALAKCGKSLSIAETPAGRLSIKGEKLTALVPCITPGEMPPVRPDPMIAALPDTIKEALKTTAVLANENADKIAFASVLLRANDCTATNGAAILQYWHGINLPPDIVLPKYFVAAVTAVKEPIIGFGFSWQDGSQTKTGSFTLYFEGGAWLFTTCYADAWPDTSQLWQQANYVDTPEGFFEAVATVSEFNEHGYCTLAPNGVWSHNTARIGAQAEVKGIQPGLSLNGKLAKTVAPYADRIDLTTYQDRAFFAGLGGKVRGIIMGVANNGTVEVEPEPEPEPSFAATMEGDDDPAASGWGSGGGWTTAVDADVPMPE